MIRRDMPEVMEITEEGFSNPWREEDFLIRLRQRNCIGMAVEYGEDVIGFMIYELHKSYLSVISFAVSKKWRRRGIGSQMVAKLMTKLSSLRRREIIVDVSERNMAALLFFRAQGFLAIDIRKDEDDSDMDEYRMSITCPEQVQWPAVPACDDAP